MHILGISAYYHDAAAALLRDGMLVAAAQEERFSRRKHDAAFPDRAIAFCLKQAGLSAADLDYVVFYEKPLKKFERILSTQVALFPRSYRVFPRAMFTWLSDKLWVRTTISKKLGIPPAKVLFTEHHQSHAAAAFLCSPFEEAAVLVMDGVGEWATTSLYHGRRGSEPALDPLAEIVFPHSLGLFYSAFTAYLGFEVNEGEYKVMGMAPYGEPRYVDDVRALIPTDPDGAFQLDLDYFCFHYHPHKSFTKKLEERFGPARTPGARFVTTRTPIPSTEEPPSSEELALNQRFADIAASVQKVTEEIVLSLASELHRRTGSPRLCMAGGVALNSVANGRMCREGPFSDVFIQPAAGDAGGALGAALYVSQVILKEGRRFVFDRADWGEELTSEAAQRFLEECRISHEAFTSEEALLEHVAERLRRGEVIGWMQGRFEWGPRALGHRSILADPRAAEMKDRVNRRIKFREAFRPFAPAVTADAADRIFDLDKAGGRGDPAQFMLMTAPVRDEWRDKVQATTHEDGSSRVQRVGASAHPRYHDLIECFGALTGVPVLLNTSFNLKGEPIVNTPLEAYSTFQRSGLDCLVLDRFVVCKEGG